jgi:hypothetical protein
MVASFEKGISMVGNREHRIPGGAIKSSRSTVSKGLKDIRGKKVTWNWEGHGVLTKDALAELRKKLPPGFLPILKWVDGVASDTQFRDVADVFTAGHWTAAGQKHHFMRDAGQTGRQAYDAAVKWICDETLQAAKFLKQRLYLENENYLEKSLEGVTMGDKSWVFEALIKDHLGNALHSLQDSFAPGHVVRDSNLVIVQINVYDKQNRDPTEAGKLPHEEYDKVWKAPNGSLTPLGKASVSASAALVSILLVSAIAADTESRFNSLKQESLISKYLKTIL